MDAAHPGDALSPRHQRQPREAAHQRRPRVPGRARGSRRRATALTSCYLARSDAALAVAELATDAHEERLTQREIAPTNHRATLAGACLLEHAAALRELVAHRTDALVTVDVDPASLERAADAWNLPH